MQTVIKKEASAGVEKLFCVGEQKEWSESEGTVVAWGSKPVVDRDLEVILGKAWTVENFMKNPVLMLCHDYSKPPVGKVLWAKATEDGLKFKARFANTPLGQEIKELYRDGIMNAFSVGFTPKRWHDVPQAKAGEARKVYDEADLLEISCVPVPCCPDALVERFQKGMLKSEELISVAKSLVDANNKAKQDDAAAVLAESVDLAGKTKQPEPPSTSSSEDITATTTPLPEKKSFSPDKQPSISQITEGIYRYLETMQSGGSVFAGEVGTPQTFYCVVDLYPINYPDGNVILMRMPYEAGAQPVFTIYEYTYEVATTAVTLYNPVEVVEQWVAKSVETKQFETIRHMLDNMIEEKAGRVLSSKNRTLLTECHGKMTDAVGALKSLLDTTGDDDTDKGCGKPKPKETEIDVAKLLSALQEKAAEETVHAQQPTEQVTAEELVEALKSIDVKTIMSEVKNVSDVAGLNIKKGQVVA